MPRLLALLLCVLLVPIAACGDAAGRAAKTGSSASGHSGSHSAKHGGGHSSGSDTFVDADTEAALERDHAAAMQQCRETTEVVDGRYRCMMGSDTIESAFPLDAKATPAERAAAEEFAAATVASTERYRDVEVARREGYTFDEYASYLASVKGTAAEADARAKLRKGFVTHVLNPTLANDGVAADPTKPDVLMYLTDGDRYELAGAMFLAPAGTHGPQMGGPLTVWHAHDHASRFVMCWEGTAVVAWPTSLPDGSKPVDRPNAGCPTGGPLARTPEMLHVWFGHGDPARTFDHSMSIGDVSGRLDKG